MGILSDFEKQGSAYSVVNIQVWREGYLLDRLDWDEEIRRNQYSVSKSFTGAAVGLAVGEGLLSLDERVTDAFPEELPARPSEHLRALTVRDLLTMRMGQAQAVLMGVDRLSTPDKNWVRHVLAQPFVLAPGAQFVYNNAGPYLAGMLVQRRAGCDLLHYLMPRLFQPLDIRLPTWEMDPLGNTFGAGGLFLTVTEVARFMQLHLQGGRWGSRQILPREWVEQAIGKQGDNNRDPHGYGYLFWRGPGDSYRCDGKYGQFGINLPEKNTVIAVNSECRQQDRLLEWIYQSVVSRL